MGFGAQTGNVNFGYVAALDIYSSMYMLKFPFSSFFPEDASNALFILSFVIVLGLFVCLAP